jgi:hypothetical protein
MAYKFRFTVLGRYRTHLKANEPAVTVTMTSGEGEHQTYAGTLTMSEAEWAAFVEALQKGLRGNLEVEDRKVTAEV